MKNFVLVIIVNFATKVNHIVLKTFKKCFSFDSVRISLNSMQSRILIIKALLRLSNSMS